MKNKENTRLKNLRKQFDLTQEQLGKKINVDQSTIVHYEAGTREPSRENKIKLALFFGVTVEFLFYESYYDHSS